MGAKHLSLLAAVALTFCARDLRAESTDCGNGNLVVTGDRIDEVLARCGNPSWQQTSIVHNRRRRWMTTRLDEWVYDRGEGTFLRYLRFYNGVLEIIEERSREP